MCLTAFLIIAIYAAHSITGSRAAQAQSSAPALNNSWGEEGRAWQYDGGINHTYYVNEPIGNINITLNDTIMGPVTAYKGLLLVSTAGPHEDQLIADYKLTPGSVAAINAYTGNVVWRTRFPNQIIGQPLTVNGTVIVAMGNNEEITPANFIEYDNNVDALYALNLTTGNVIWTTPISAPAMPTPAFSEGIFIAPDMGWFHIVNASTGKIIRNVQTGLPDTMSSPLLINGTAYFGAGTTDEYTSKNITGNFMFYRVNVSSGNIVWQKQFPPAGSGMNDVVAVLYKGVVITGYLNHSMYTNPVLVGLNATNGNIIWTLDELDAAKHMGVTYPPPISQDTEFLTEPTMSAVTLWHGTAYADSNYGGILFAVNATTGKPIWAFGTGQTESNPNIHDGYLYIVNDVGVLYVLNATDGSMIKQVNTGMHHLSNEVTITKNNMILTSLEGRVVTIPISNLTSR